MENPTISFIIPHLGESERRIKGLQNCIDSIKTLEYPQNLIDIHVIEGPETVPQKVKKGVEQSKGEWIVYGSNDCEFSPDSIKNVLEVYKIKMVDKKFMAKRLIAFNTGEIYLDQGNICEHFMIKRDLIDELDNKEIFHTDFHHVGCDNYLWAQCIKMNEAIRCPDAVVHHYHFSKGAELDDVYQKGWKKVEQDREILKKKLLCLN